MRKLSAALTALVIAVAAASGAAAKDGVKYASPEAAFEQGLGAYKSGYYEFAIPALKEAADKGADINRFFAAFYLARIYADNNGAHTDHAKAYMLYQKLADENADIDPDDGQRAPFVAKALTALAGYLQTGVKDIGLAPDPERAVDYLHHAATFFGDKDAQFELAKIYLASGSPDDVKRGMHYLSVLTEVGYPGAQAYLADLLWRGRFVKKDERRALALITMAAENAPAHERIWIEDIYQNIFCGSTQGTRSQADGMVARWRQVFTLPSVPSERMTLGGRDLQPSRACGNGEQIDIQRRVPAAVAASPAPASAPAAKEQLTATRPASGPEAMQGNALGIGLRDIGTSAK